MNYAEAIIERAAIMEHDGELTRAYAQQQALDEWRSRVPPHQWPQVEREVLRAWRQA